MLALRDLQTAFRQALLEDDKTAAAALGVEIADGELSASERLAVYRNNIFASLTDALKETFPVICRLVDERSIPDRKNRDHRAGRLPDDPIDHSESVLRAFTHDDDREVGFQFRRGRSDLGQTDLVRDDLVPQ